ncbi:MULTISPECIES: GTP-binding protein [Caldisericum]|jgi:small GTP-binding protein|uniref:GTP-binding protein n=1 Tax=Caldisericum TaxID=693074 RepID=UPI0039FD56E0
MRHYKIVVTGPFAAGKTTFIKTITEISPIVTEAPTTRDEEAQVKDSTTVAMDFGRITVDDDYVLHIFGTPGQFRFNYMWSILSKDALGVILLVDSGDRSMIEEAKDMLNFFRVKTDAPIVVALNHFNEKEHISEDELKSIMNIPDSIPVVGCDATNKESVKNVLLKLLELILENDVS